MSAVTTLRSAAAATAATVALTLSLGACSVAGTSFDPGVAARVGDTTVTTNDVDRLSVATCRAFEAELEQNNQVVPLRFLKSSVVQALTLEAAARAFGDDYGVRPSSAYTREVDSATSAAGDLPASQVEAVVLLRTSSTLINDVLGQVGAKIAASTADDDVKGSAPAADSDEAASIGGQAFGTWLDAEDIKIDPQYDVELTPTGPEAVDTSVSFAVGDTAKAGAADEPDQEATMLLPASQRCGSSNAAGGAAAGSGGAG